MLGQNARKTARDWSDGQDIDDDPDSVLGVQVSLVEAMRSIRAAGVASGHGGASGHDGTPDEGSRGRPEGGALDEQGTNPVGGTTAKRVGEDGL